MNAVLAGPFVGELGWELFCWQGRLRWMSRSGVPVYVLCRPGHEFLYRDFASFALPGGTQEGPYNRGIDVLPANHLLVDYRPNWSDERLEKVGFNAQVFAEWPRRSSEFDVLIHARARADIRPECNWPAAKWDELAGRLGDLRIGWIGTHAAAYANDRGQDWRGVGLDTTAEMIRAAKVVVGTSSGPMHLASLCRVPHVILSGEENRLRYERHWNPHHTRVEFVPSWQPAVEDVERAVRSCLQETLK